MPNQMPPANIEPADMWAQITALPRPHRVVDFPRKDAEGNPIARLAMIPLTQGESMAVTTSTERFVRKMLKEEGGVIPGSTERSDGYTTLFENRSALEILFRVCRKADDLSKTFFPSIEKIAASLTVDEIGVLFSTYNIVRSEIGPIVAYMSQDEMDAWIEKLATGGATDPLAFLTLAARSDLLMYSATQLHRSRTGNSSPTEQQEGNT